MPLLDVVVLAQLLDVSYEIPRRVVLEAGGRRTLARSTLVERENLVVRWVEPAALWVSRRVRVRAGDAAAVQLTSLSEMPPPGPP